MQILRLALESIMYTGSDDNSEHLQSRAPTQSSEQPESSTRPQLILFLFGGFYILLGLVGRFLYLELAGEGQITTADYVMANLCWITPLVSTGLATLLIMARRNRSAMLVASLLPILLYLLYIAIAAVLRI